MTAARQVSAEPSMESLRALRTEILAAAARHGASNVRVYGSVARGEARSDSDIDLLVDMDAGRSLLDLAGLHLELEDMLGFTWSWRICWASLGAGGYVGLHLELEDMLGFQVEIGTDVKPRLRERVHAEAIAL